MTNSSHPPKPVYNYPMLKNHIHNTLDLSKEQIREYVEQAINDIVERKVEVLVRDKLNMQHLVDQAIMKSLEDHNWYWGESEDKLGDYVRKEVVRKLIDGVKLHVEIAGPKRVTETGDKRMKVRRTKK